MKKNEKTIFPDGTVYFLKQLSKNNNREWFNSNRDMYENFFLFPLKDFVISLGERLKELSPDIKAIPAVDKSIFRLHRDVRFSKNKNPYKTNCGILFWEGDKPKLDCPGFYFHLEPGYYFIANGFYIFPDNVLNNYRTSIQNSSKEKELIKIIDKLSKMGYQIGGEKLKKIPKGFSSTSDLILYKSIYGYMESKKIDELKSKGDVADFVFEKMKPLYPLHKWLLNNT